MFSYNYMSTVKEYVLNSLQNRIDELKQKNDQVIILENKLRNLTTAFLNSPYELKVEDSYLQFIEDFKHLLMQDIIHIDIPLLERYNHFILQIFGYYHIFNNYIENRMTKKVHTIVENPRVLFDSVFYLYEKPDMEKTDYILYVLDDLKYIYNCIINTRDEFEFDLNIIDFNKKEANYIIISVLENLHSSFQNELITT